MYGYRIGEVKFFLRRFAVEKGVEVLGQQLAVIVGVSFHGAVRFFEAQTGCLVSSYVFSKSPVEISCVVFGEILLDFLSIVLVSSFFLSYYFGGLLLSFTEVLPVFLGFVTAKFFPRSYSGVDCLITYSVPPEMFPGARGLC